MSDIEIPQTFLIIEDSPDQILILKAYITNEFPTSTILTANNLKDGIEIIDKTPPKVLVLDVHLGAGGPDELLLKFPSGKREFSVLVVTGDKSDDTLSHMMALGVDDLVLKPIDELIFQSKLRSLVSGRYMSPLSFHGRKEGLGNITFPAQAQVIYVDESVVRFKNRFALVKGARIETVFEGHPLKMTVRGFIQDPNLDDQFEIEAEIDDLEDAAAGALRRFIFRLMTQS